MGTVKRNPFLAGIAAILGGVMLVANVASAELGSDKAGAILVFPKLLADSGVSSPNKVDTEIQISNTSTHQIGVRCYLVNANSHCSNAGASVPGGGTVPLVCTSSSECTLGGLLPGGTCVPAWNEQDFRFTLTARQPIVWRLSEGMVNFPLSGFLYQEEGFPPNIHVGPVDNDPNLPAPLQGQPAVNIDSRVPPAPEDPFLGELKCVQVDLASEQPSPGTESVNNFSGDLAGVATIITQTPSGDVDARSYNAIGIQAVADAFPVDNNTLRLGTDGQYDGCPSILIVDHFFDYAPDPATDTEVNTTLTLVPCSENFFLQNGGRVSTVAQMLIFNEFEQRLSTSRTIKCLDTVPLSDITTAPGPSDDKTSIFNVGVQGTLTGQTRIRAVDGSDPTRGDGLLGLVEEFHSGMLKRSAALNLHQTGIRFNPDFIVLAPPQL